MQSPKEVENLNEITLKKMLVNFERRYNENQKLRIKYQDEPTKFASSETELFASLDELQSVAAQPELYHILIDKKVPHSFMSILTHENHDITAKVISILHDLTDCDEDERDHTPYESLIRSLLESNVIDVIVDNLSSFDKSNKDEANAIRQSLDIFHNLIEFESGFEVNTKPLIVWMVRQLNQSSEFNAIKLSIAELLSVLLMQDAENKLYLCEVGGIEALLQQMAYYRRVVPTIGDEHEFLEQVINCLCSVVLNFKVGRESFFVEEGVDLVELILREKHESVKKSNIKLSTLKLLAHVLTTDENQDPVVTKCCERFIEILGLRVLFPLFNCPKHVLSERVKKREYHSTLDEAEEHLAAVILALLKHCQNSEYLQRILIKFAENSFEKLQRAISMHEKYFRIVQNHDEDNVPSSTEFTLRSINYILLLVCFLSQQFETYDPTSGETFINHIGKVFTSKPQLRHQIIMNSRNHLNEVAEGSEEYNSLSLLLKEFEQLSKSRQAAKT